MSAVPPSSSPGIEETPDMSLSPSSSTSSLEDSPPMSPSSASTASSLDDSLSRTMSPASSISSHEEPPTASSKYQAPGRIGDPHLKFFQEPRAHPKLVETFRAFGLDGSQPNPYAHMKIDELASAGQIAQHHVDTSTMYEMLPNDLPEDEHEPRVKRSTMKFTTYDGTERNLYIFRPADVEGPLPAVMYTASAVTILDTANKVHFRWCTSLAVEGLVAIAVDFRSAWEKGRHNPFPAGLNDCAAAFKHIDSHKVELGIDKIVLQGESGGANLALATALKAKKEGWVDQISGVYGISPFISNAYGWSDERKLEELPSLFECEGYWFYNAMLAGMGTWYSGADDQNPLAWPYHAAVEDCVGLPPHVLTMDELCPLRDEGMAYYRKLLAAGVEVNASVNLGVVQGSGLIFRRLLPEIHNKAIREVAAFVKSL